MQAELIRHGKYFKLDVKLGECPDCHSTQTSESRKYITCTRYLCLNCGCLFSINHEKENVEDIIKKLESLPTVEIQIDYWKSIRDKSAVAKVLYSANRRALLQLIACASFMLEYVGELDCKSKVCYDTCYEKIK
jgi:hypothetical protein